jgi:hypothetical protein
MLSIPLPEIGPRSGKRSVHCSECEYVYRISTAPNLSDCNQLIQNAFPSYPETIENNIRVSSRGE